MLSIKQDAAAGGILTSFVTFLSGRAALSAIPDLTAISVITINGKSEGKTHSAHIANP